MNGKEVQSSNRCSFVWNYFKNLNNGFALCTLCSRKIKRPGSSTSAMQTHLNCVHKLHREISLSNCRPADDDTDAEISGTQKKKVKRPESESGSSSAQSTIDSFTKRQSLSEILAKCAAKDGFSVKAMRNSECVRGYVSSKNYSMPRSEATIWKHISKFYDEEYEKMKIEISKMKAKKLKFSFEIDEWTDRAGKRFLNMFLHGENTWHQLGIVPIPPGSCTAGVIKELIDQKFADIGLSLKNDIVSSTSDGASVMCKYSSLITYNNQLCFNHALHLAITDILYPKKEKSGTNPEDNENESDPVSDTDDDESISNLNSDDDNDNETETEYVEAGSGLEFEESDFHAMRMDLKEALDYVRKIVRIFRKSPVKKSNLKEIMNSYNKKFKIPLLDMKTRWNSIVPMVERYLEIQNFIEKTLKKCGGTDYKLYDTKYDDTLRQILECLSPLFLAVKQLSERSLNLLKCEAILILLLNNISKNNSLLAMDLKKQVLMRINERRNQELITLMIFLEKGSIPENNEFFQYSSRQAIKKKANDIIRNLSLSDSDLISEPAPSHSSNIDTEVEIVDTADDNDYNTILKNIVRPERNIANNLDTAWKILQTTKNATGVLEQLRKALKTISPTSTNCERTFSTAGNFVTKIRSKLDSKTINQLVFLKYFFLNQN